MLKSDNIASAIIKTFHYYSHFLTFYLVYE